MNQQVMLNMLLNQLKNRNPNGYNQVMSMMNSGQKPQNIIQNMLNNGQITQDQLNNAMNYLNNNGGNNKRF